MVKIDKTNVFEDRREKAWQTTELDAESKIAYLLDCQDEPKIQIFSAQGIPITQLSLPYDHVNTILYHPEKIQKAAPSALYFAGPGVFAKIKNEEEIEEILTYERPKLPGTENGLFDVLFNGMICNLFPNQEYIHFIQFESNTSPAITVLYNPDKNEFYISPCVMRKGYKLSLDNKVEEIIPYLAEQEKEDFENWKKDFKIILNE